MKSDFKILDPSYCVMNNRKIDLWFLSLHEKKPQLYHLLSEDEKKRAMRFHFSHHRRRFINARGLLRLILGRYLHCRPDQIQFNYNKQGKPNLNHPEQIEFNISHSGEWVLIAIGCINPLGVDIESYSARSYLGIASHIFSKEEQEMLKSAHPTLIPWLFFNFWAQKEAFIKACGLGLSYPTKQFNVSISYERKQTVYDPQNKAAWIIKPFQPKIALSAAICHHPEIEDIYFQTFSTTKGLFQ